MDIINVVAYYFEDISNFNYANAKNKVKSVFVSEELSILLNWLYQFADYERNYFHFIFLTQKQLGWINRKKHNESFFDLRFNIINWFKNRSLKSAIPVEVVECLEIVIDHRCSMIEFYRQLSKQKSDMLFSISNSLVKLKEIQAISKSNFEPYRNKIIGEMWTLMNLEMNVLSNLLLSHEKMINLYFLDPLNALKNAHDLLNKFPSEKPPLVNWLNDVSRFLLDKYTLYFQPILLRFSVLLDPSFNIFKPDAFPLVDKLKQSLIKFGTNSNNVPICTGYLLFDTTQQTHDFIGHGYVLPTLESNAAPLIGIQNYQTIFSTQNNQLSQNDLYIAVSLIREKLRTNQDSVRIVHLQNQIQSSSSNAPQSTSAGSTTGSSFSNFSPQSNHYSTCSTGGSGASNKPHIVTYFVCRLEPRMFLVLVFDCVKSEKEKSVLSFLNEYCLLIQGYKLMDQLPQ